MRPQDSYYIMIGKRYLRFAVDQWSCTCLARQPLPDCELTREQAFERYRWLQKMKALDPKIKKSMSIQRIIVTTEILP